MNAIVTEQSTMDLDLPFYVYIMTNARCGPYHLGIAKEIIAIDNQRARYRRESCGINPPELRDVFFSVWYEECINEFAAQKRADEISLMPYSWQRGLIESVNPQWIDFAGLGAGLPYEYINVLPEIAGMPFRKLSQL
jgi:putative endonuclease